MYDKAVLNSSNLTNFHASYEGRFMCVELGCISANIEFM